MAVSRINEAGLNINQYGNRNLIINGAMQVAQRGTSSTGITSQGYRTVDRFKITMQAGNAGTWTETQESDGPSGFSNSQKVLCTTANASLGSGAYFFISQHMEAQNFQHLDYGSSGAKTLALSFYVKSNKTGTYNFELSNSDASSLYYNTHQYTISSANTWEKKTIIITGSTSDAIDNNNQKGLNVTFWLLAGTDYSGGTYNENTWHGTEANRAVGNVNLADATNNYWQITGVQLEVGDTATDFEHRTFADELARCHRYYQRVSETGGSGSNNYLRYGIGSNLSTTQSEIHVQSMVPMRADPTLETTGTLSNYALYDSDSVVALTALVLESGGHGTNQRFILDGQVSSGLTDGGACQLINNNNSTGYLAFSAEL